MDVGIDMKGPFNDGIDVSPGMIGPVDDGPSSMGVPRAASKPRIKIVRSLPVGRIVLVKRHLLSCLVSGGKSEVSSEQSQS